MTYYLIWSEGGERGRENKGGKRGRSGERGREGKEGGREGERKRRGGERKRREGGSPPGGTLPKNSGRGVPHGSQNPDPISDQNI